MGEPDAGERLAAQVGEHLGHLGIARVIGIDEQHLDGDGLLQEAVRGADTAPMPPTEMRESRWYCRPARCPRGVVGLLGVGAFFICRMREAYFLEWACQQDHLSPRGRRSPAPQEPARQSFREHLGRNLLHGPGPLGECAQAFTQGTGDGEHLQSPPPPPDDEAPGAGTGRRATWASASSPLSSSASQAQARPVRWRRRARAAKTSSVRSTGRSLDVHPPPVPPARDSQRARPAGRHGAGRSRRRVPRRPPPPAARAGGAGPMRRRHAPRSAPSRQTARGTRRRR
jgi:hypothetical protein